MQISTENKAEVADLIRTAARQQVALWDTLREIEEACGEELDALDGLIDDLAVSWDDRTPIPDEVLLKHLEELGG